MSLELQPRYALDHLIEVDDGDLEDVALWPGARATSTTSYVWRDGEWILLFHQQTLLKQ
jgi:hypothetical protein